MRPDHGYPRAFRITRRRDYQKVYDEGLRVPGRRLVLFARPRSPGEGARLGVTASRRVGGAVARNRAKRLIREAFRRHRAEFGDLDLVVNARAGAALASGHEIERELVSLVRRARAGLARREEGR
ncbi:MAG: ribonuclease P protein component [Acidobacteriota bacterium]